MAQFRAPSEVGVVTAVSGALPLIFGIAVSSVLMAFASLGLFRRNELAGWMRARMVSQRTTAALGRDQAAMNMTGSTILKFSIACFVIGPIVLVNLGSRVLEGSSLSSAQTWLAMTSLGLGAAALFFALVPLGPLALSLKRGAQFPKARRALAIGAALAVLGAVMFGAGVALLLGGLT